MMRRAWRMRETRLVKSAFELIGSVSAATSLLMRSSSSRKCAAHACTLLAFTRRRSARMRAWRSVPLNVSARAIVSAIASMSYGLTISASPSSSAAPANSLSTSTPSSSSRDATNSFATRFMPSRSGVTSITSAAR